MKKITILLTLFTSLIFTSCTDNQSVKNWGGTEEIGIPEGRNFVNITWKEDDLWIVTEDSSYYYFTEQSSWGILEGEIKIKKSRIDNTQFDSFEFYSNK